MKQWLGYLVAVIAISALVYNELVDETTERTFFRDMREHHLGEKSLYSQLTDFVGAGPRNTAYQGYALCVRIREIEKAHHPDLESIDCESTYNLED